MALIYKPATVDPGRRATRSSTRSVDPRFDRRPRTGRCWPRRSSDDATGGVVHGRRQPPQVEGLRLRRRRRPRPRSTVPGNCNLTRTLAAEALVDWLATDPTGSGDGDVLIIGDLNSYDKEDPIDAISPGRRHARHRRRLHRPGLRVPRRGCLLLRLRRSDRLPRLRVGERRRSRRR